MAQTLRAHLALMVGQNIAFKLANGQTIRGKLTQAEDEFVLLTGAVELLDPPATNVSPRNPIPGNGRFPTADHWHLMLQNVLWFGSSEPHP